jgi:hypothetical protein
VLQPDDFLCDAGSGDLCDPDDFCPGVAGQQCVKDLASASTVCKEGSGDSCDPDEFCTGVRDEPCPADYFQDAALDGNGLWGVSGDGAPANPSTLFQVSPVSAGTALFRALGNGDGGESIAFDPSVGRSGRMFHWSGFLDLVMETIDLGTGFIRNVPTDFTAYRPQEIWGSTRDPSSGDFFFTDKNQNLGSVTPGGAFSLIGPLVAEMRGLTFQDGLLYAGELDSNTLHELDPATAASNATVPVTLPGYTVYGINGLTADGAGTLYAIVRTIPPGVPGAGKAGRRLVTVDPSSGQATDIGRLPSGFANIEFGGASRATVCRVGSGDSCDPDELCPGVAGGACPTDIVLTPDDVCRVGSGDLCDPDEFCTGIPRATCPPDGFEPAGFVCNPGSGDVCDPEESCLGEAGQPCPADTVAPPNTLCNAGSGDFCDPDEFCTGMADAACPADRIEPDTTVCNPGSGDLCDPDELCPGVADASCPSDVVSAMGTLCRASQDPSCDPEELCTGSAGAPCPIDAFAPDGSLCDDADTCTQADACLAGACNGDSVELDVSKRCLVLPVQGPREDCQGGVVEAVFEYTGLDCSASSNLQGAYASCFGDPAGASVDVTVAAYGYEIGVDPEIGLTVGGQLRVTALDAELPSQLALDLAGGPETQSLAIQATCSAACG